MTNTETKISEIKLMSAMKELKESENVSDDVIMSFIHDVHSLMSQYRMDFRLEKNDATFQECDNFADFVIDLAYTIVLGVARRFELPVDQMRHMKMQFAKTIMFDSNVARQAFAWNFTILMLNNFKINQALSKTNLKDN